MRQIKFIEHLAQDIHFGLRLLWRSPGFDAMAIISIAMGVVIAAIASPAIASLLYGVRPSDPVVFLWSCWPCL